MAPVRFPPNQEWVEEPDLTKTNLISSTFLQVSRTVEDFTEQEVTKAFQGECQTQGGSYDDSKAAIHPSDILLLLLALRGETGKMRETHEAYQVLLVLGELGFNYLTYFS